MSYAIWLDDGSDDHASWTYTSNCAPMWRIAGADLAVFDGHLASGCEPVLRRVIDRLRRWPSFFASLNPANGWGCYETLVPMLERLADEFAASPLATVRVWR